MLPRPPLTSEVLTLAHSKLLRVETRETIAHVHHILVIEHLMEIEGPEVVIEQVLPILLTYSGPSISSHLLLSLLLLTLLLLPLLFLLLPLLFLLLPPEVFHLSCKRGFLSKELIHEVSET